MINPCSRFLSEQSQLLQREVSQRLPGWLAKNPRLKPLKPSSPMPRSKWRKTSSPDPRPNPWLSFKLQAPCPEGLEGQQRLPFYLADSAGEDRLPSDNSDQ